MIRSLYDNVFLESEKLKLLTASGYFLTKDSKKSNGYIKDLSMELNDSTIVVAVRKM